MSAKTGCEEERSYEAPETVRARKRQTSLTTSPNMLWMAVALCGCTYLAFTWSVMLLVSLSY